MKNSIHILILIFLTNVVTIIAQIAVPWNHCELHGFGGDPKGMSEIDNHVAFNYPRFFGAPRYGVRPDIMSFSQSFNYQTDEKIPTVFSMPPAGRLSKILKSANYPYNYIAIGHSLGGLFARALVHNQDWSDTTNLLVRGFITIGTPNEGVDMIRNARFFSELEAQAQIKMGRGDLSILNVLGGAIWEIIRPVIHVVSILAQSNIPQLQESEPGSNFLKNANGPNLQKLESRLPSGRAIVWGDYGDLKFPGYSEGRVGSEKYRAVINEAQSKSNWHSNEESNLKSQEHWWTPIIAIKRIWHGLRAIDWKITRDGYWDANNAWEWATANRGASDTFISTNSQKGIPNVKIIEKINNKPNEEIIHTDEDEKWISILAVERALIKMGITH